MAAVLEKLRKTFVEKVSKEIVKQLLDDLEDDKILNSGEAEAIIEENPRTTDKARKLIDNVRRKGDKASNRLIHHLQMRDATLHEELCKECGLTPGVKEKDTVAQKTPQLSVEEHVSLEQQKQPNEEHDGPSRLMKITKSFWSQKMESKDTYPVTITSVKNRVALLIINIDFKSLKYRNGAQKDEENMEKLLSDFCYEVIKYTNFTAKQMDDALLEFSKHPKLKETDSVFVVIMSHGKRDAILGVNYSDDEPDALPIDNIYKRLNAENCPLLDNKPKIIIIQACRGEQRGSVMRRDDVESDDLAERDIEEDALRFIHKEKDFIALLSCTPDTVSYRDRLKGSFLIQFIIEVFNNFAHEDDIEVLFKKVRRQFVKDETLPDWVRQMATTDRCTLTEDFFLFPGLTEIL